MSEHKATFGVGNHRPIYLWAGPGTVRMNRLKFMNAPVDEAVHQEAHTLTGATRVAQEAQCNWAYLMYDWGFPPEIEREDWAAFRQAVPVYHAAGVYVFGYVQLSNYVVDGSYADKEWYARDPRGRPFYYYTGRYMVCWQHPDWITHLKQMVWEIISAEADGVFFDNPWYGTQPLLFGGSWLGGAGCYCERCRGAYHEATGQEIPIQIDPNDDASYDYLRWRADQVTETIADLADYARSLNPDVVISVNDFDAIMRPSFVTYGIDLEALSEVQDVMMIEDFALPRWTPPQDDAPGQLVNNALTIRTARPLIGETPLSVDPYDKGIGFDEVYTPRRFRQGIAEAAACGAPMVVKGTEFVDESGTFTLLTAAPYAEQREAIGELHRWLKAHADLYTDRRNQAAVGLLHPGASLWRRWTAIAAPFFAVGQTLLHAGVPWRVVTADALPDNLEVLLHVTPLPQGIALPPEIQSLNVMELPGWTLPPASTLQQRPRLRGFVARFLAGVYRAYFRYRWARQLLDRSGVTQRHFLQSPFFELPEATRRETLLEALSLSPSPWIDGNAPTLVEHWQQADEHQLHLVNYGAAPQTVTVHFPADVTGTTIALNHDPVPIQGNTVNVDLDVYAVMLYTPEH
jgi:hypothetical protein